MTVGCKGQMCFDHDGHSQWSTTTCKHILVAFLGQNNSYAIELALNPLADSKAESCRCSPPRCSSRCTALGESLVPRPPGPPTPPRPTWLRAPWAQHQGWALRLRRRKRRHPRHSWAQLGERTHLFSHEEITQGSITQKQHEFSLHYSANPPMVATSLCLNILRAFFDCSSFRVSSIAPKLPCAHCH